MTQPTLFDAPTPQRPPRTFARAPLVPELARRQNNNDRCLAALRAHPDGLTNLALMQIAGARAGARVQHWRDRGYVITCTHEAGAVWRYRLEATA